MQRWTFEPGHTAAEFCVRHMMVTNVRGHFKNVHGSLEFDPESPALARVEAVIKRMQRTGVHASPLAGPPAVDPQLR